MTWRLFLDEVANSFWYPRQRSSALTVCELHAHYQPSGWSVINRKVDARVDVVAGGEAVCYSRPNSRARAMA